MTNIENAPHSTEPYAEHLLLVRVGSGKAVHLFERIGDFGYTLCGKGNAENIRPATGAEVSTCGRCAAARY